MSQPMNRATILNMVYTMQADAVANAYAAIAAENEQLKAAGLTLAESSDNAIWSLKQQLAVCEKKLEWLRQSEHLVIWDGERWKVRHQSPQTPLPKSSESE